MWPPHGIWPTLPSRTGTASAGYLVCLLRVSPGPAACSGPPKHRQSRKAGQRPRVLTQLPGQRVLLAEGDSCVSPTWEQGPAARPRGLRDPQRFNHNLWVLSQHRRQTPLGCQLPETFQTAHRKEAGGSRQAAVAGLASAFHAVSRGEAGAGARLQTPAPFPESFHGAIPSAQTHEKGKSGQAPHAHRGKVRLT